MSQAAVAYDSGRSQIVADLNTPLGLALYRYGLTSPDLELTRLLLRPGDCFIDAGANIGLFSLVAAAKVGPSGRVLAFEPVPASAESARRNARLNGFTWVDVSEVALADRPGRQAFYVFQGFASGFSSFSPDHHQSAIRTTTRLVTLDECLNAHDRGILRFIKIDVEGAEMRVLRGAANVLDSLGPDMLVELEPGHLARQGVSVPEIRDFLCQFGYRPYAITQEGGGHLRATACDWMEQRETPNVFLTRYPRRIEAAGVKVR